jgi:uncharacterized protein involved in type VI secretion and phage assembly
MLAGVAVFAVLSHGPTFEQPDLTPDQQAANEEAFSYDLQATIGFLSQMFTATEDNEYDGRWDPVMTCVVTGYPGQAPSVIPGDGWKE